MLAISPTLLERWPSLFPVATVMGGRRADWPACLQVEDPQHGIVPAALDANSAQWILKKNLGDIIEVRNEQDWKITLLVTALLQESIFQSEALISEGNFRRFFPQQEGASFFLVDCTDASDADVAHIRAALETALADYGVRLQTPAERLQAYFGVENMYLETFEALGGLGLILGAVGLAIVLLRGVWERRGELALLRRSVSRRRGSPGSCWRRTWRSCCSVWRWARRRRCCRSRRTWRAPARTCCGLRIGVLLLLVLATGVLAGALAVATTLRTPLLTALRRE